MKKQINPNIQAHLLRSAFYLLLVVAVCAIPFALAQRDVTEQGMIKLGSASQESVDVRNVLPGNIITVINSNDSGPGSLRQALSDANNGDTIDFDSSLKGQTITLTSGQLLVNRSVAISGLGANNLTVDGNANGSVFYTNPDNTVTISGLTITNGHGIYNDRATLTLSNCAISGNESFGIFNFAGFLRSATLTVNNSTLSANQGPGIDNVGYVAGSATVTVTNSTLSGNGDHGILNQGAGNDTSPPGSATVTVTNSTLSENSGSSIYNFAFQAFATVTVSNSTLSGNSASQGGGIYNSDELDSLATVTITNSTLSGNSASQGGGIYNISTLGSLGSATLAVTNSTLSGNSASQGGGIYNDGATTSLTIGDTILNAGASGENIYNHLGTVSSLGYNLSSDNGGGYLIGPGDQINTDPLLGPLQNNGGPTYTHALLPGSPAIDAGDPNFTPPPRHDQRGRGFHRVVHGRIDIGSFEVQR